jgi:hypothetical protein
MTATGQLIPLPVLPIAGVRQGNGEPMSAKDQSGARRSIRPRIYRIPKPEPQVTNGIYGIYGIDGCMSYESAIGRRIDIFA